MALQNSVPLDSEEAQVRVEVMVPLELSVSATVMVYTPLPLAKRRVATMEALEEVRSDGAE